MDKVTFGYVGCGRLAQAVHHPNFLAIPECDFIGLAEVRPRLLHTVADRLRIPRRYESHLDMAEDADISAVGISAEFAAQGDIAIDFLERGKAVFLEKPMATSVEQARRILRAESEGGGRLMVAYMSRYDAGNQLAREWIREFKSTGELGGITFVRIHSFGGDWTAGLDTPVDPSDEKLPEPVNHKPAWLPEQWHRPYVLYLQQFTHNVNLTRWLLDAPGKPSVRMADLAANTYSGTVIFDCGGVRCNLETGLVDYHGYDDNTQVFFEKGWVKRTIPPQLLRNACAEVEVYRARPRRELIKPAPDPAFSWMYKREAEAFIRNVLSGEPFDSTGQDTLADVEFFEDLFAHWLGLPQR